jgi:phage shock protein A
VKVKALHEQVASMEKIVGQMKVNKEQVHKQVQQLRQRIDQLINDITVGLIKTREILQI